MESVGPGHRAPDRPSARATSSRLFGARARASRAASRAATTAPAPRSATRQPPSGALGRPPRGPTRRAHRRNGPSRRGRSAMEDALPSSRSSNAATRAFAEGALPEREPEPRSSPACSTWIGHLSEGAVPARRAPAALETYLCSPALGTADLSSLRRQRRRRRPRLSSRRGAAGPGAAPLPHPGKTGSSPPPAFLLGPRSPQASAELAGDGLALDRLISSARDAFGTRHRACFRRARLLLLIEPRGCHGRGRGVAMPDLTNPADRGDPLRRGARRALSLLRALHHHGALAARRARRAEAGASPAPLRDAGARLDPAPATRNAPASSATSSASSTRMATSRSMTRSCASRRISRALSADRGAGQFRQYRRR